MEEKSLIVAIINKGFSEQVMDAARSAGASGGTILTGRGTCGEDIKKFFSLTIQEEKEALLIVVENAKKNAIMSAIAENGGSGTPAAGIVFSLPVDDTLGMTFEPFNKD